MKQYSEYNLGLREGQGADMLMDKLITDLTEDYCDFASSPACSSQKAVNDGSIRYSVEYLAENLPAVQFVVQFYLELIIHGGMVAKDHSNQDKLDDWLHSQNVIGQTNGNVIRDALLASITYGYSGLRKVYDGLVHVQPNHFKIWKIPYVDEDGHPIPGLKQVAFYECMSKGESLPDKREAKEYGVDERKNIIERIIDEQNYVKAPDGSYYVQDGEEGMTATSVFVLAKNFCHLRHSDDGEYGVSPLASDRLRTSLIVDYIRNVIDEVNNDGTDYLMFLRQRGLAGSSLGAAFSSDSAEAALVAATDKNQVQSAREKQLNAARVLAQKLKRTQKTRIGIVDRTGVESIEKLAGTVNLKDYVSILNEAKGVVADIYGIPALLAGSSGGGWSTGMSALIPFTLERTIKPFQQRYAEQLAPMIRECSGVRGDIKFQEINWEDEKTRAEIDKLVAETNKAIAETNVITASLATKSDSSDLNAE